MKTTNKEKYSIAMSVKLTDIVDGDPLQTSPSPLHSLTKSELAELYFPGAPRSSALRLLHKYITNAHGLLPALEQVGYTRTSRRLTRRQVQLIFEYLGEP